MKRVFSAGGIVLRQAQDKFSKNKWEVLLVFNDKMKYWGFPKGHIEEGQTSEEAALREVKEEGGVKAEIIGKVGYSKYVYEDPCFKEKVFKIVTFYLMKYISGDPKDHDWEISEAGWFTPEVALKKLGSEDKNLLRLAMKKILSLARKTLPSPAANVNNISKKLWK